MKKNLATMDKKEKEKEKEKENLLFTTTAINDTTTTTTTTTPPTSSTTKLKETLMEEVSKEVESEISPTSLNTEELQPQQPPQQQPQQEHQQKENEDEKGEHPPQISEDGSLIPNTFSDIFKQRISVSSTYSPSLSSVSTPRAATPSSYLFDPSSSIRSNRTSKASRSSYSSYQYPKLLNLDRLVLSDAMVKHINNFKLPAQRNARTSLDTLFDSLPSQEILNKILAREDPSAYDSEEPTSGTSFRERLQTEIGPMETAPTATNTMNTNATLESTFESLIRSLGTQENDNDEETKFNLNSEASLSSLQNPLMINSSNASRSPSPSLTSSSSPSPSTSMLTREKIRAAFKYIDTIRRSRTNPQDRQDPLKTFLDLVPSLSSSSPTAASARKSRRHYRGYDRVATSKRNHLYYTIMEIINDIKKDIFFNPWHELNEKLNKAILENIEWEESIQQFQKHWKLERQSFPELQAELEKWNQEYNEQIKIIEQYNRELGMLNRQINSKRKKEKQVVLFIFGMILAELLIFLYIRFFVFTDRLPVTMQKNGFWLPFLKSIVQKYLTS